MIQSVFNPCLIRVYPWLKIENNIRVAIAGTSTLRSNVTSEQLADGSSSARKLHVFNDRAVFFDEHHPQTF